MMIYSFPTRARRAPTRREIWEQFRNDCELMKAYRITPRELEDIRTVAMLGNLKSVRDFIFILNIKRGALDRQSTERVNGMGKRRQSDAIPLTT